MDGQMNGKRIGTRLCANPWTALAGAVLLALALWAGVPAHGQLLSSGLELPPIGTGPPPLAPGLSIDPLLSELLRTADPHRPIEAVVTLDHYPTATNLLAIQASGVQVR